MEHSTTMSHTITVLKGKNINKANSNEEKTSHWLRNYNDDAKNDKKVDNDNQNSD